MIGARNERDRSLMHLAELFIRPFSFYIDARGIRIEPAARSRIFSLPPPLPSPLSSSFFSSIWHHCYRLRNASAARRFSPSRRPRYGHTWATEGIAATAGRGGGGGDRLGGFEDEDLQKESENLYEDKG